MFDTVGLHDANKGYRTNAPCLSATTAIFNWYYFIVVCWSILASNISFVSVTMHLLLGVPHHIAMESSHADQLPHILHYIPLYNLIPMLHKT